MKLCKQLFTLFFLLTLGITSSLPVFAGGEDELPPVTIVQATNLHSDAALAQSHHIPILLMFAQHGCSWCEYVEEDQLKPMLRNADYRAKVIIRQVMLDDLGSITDFDGSLTDANTLAIRYNAALTPTVVFVDDHGKQLVNNLIGVRNTEFYGGELDNALAQSEQKLRKKLAVLGLN